MDNAKPLQLLWLAPKVQFKGKGIMDAWKEEMALKGWHFTDDYKEADLVLFGSDSQLREDYIGEKPTICYFWGWYHERFVERRPIGNVSFEAFIQHQIGLMAHCTRVLVPSLTTYYQACQFGLRAQACIPGIDARTLSTFQAPFAQKKDQVLFISRLEPYKGLNNLISAMSMIKPVPSLLVVGPGDPTPYQTMASSLGVPVMFTELTDKEKGTAIQESKVLVHPSEYEGFGLPPLEALFLETPVIAADIPHMRWLLQEDALYFTSLEGLAESISLCLKGHPAIRQKTELGKRRVQAILTLERACNDLWAHIHQTIKEHWAGVIRQDPSRWKAAYEAEHRRNWEYGGESSPPGAAGPARFDPTWSRHFRAKFFVDELTKAGATSILDVGSGAVYPTIFAMAGFQVTALDISEEALRQAHEIATKWGVLDKVVTQQGDAHALPFPDGSFSAVVQGEILEHVPDPENIIAEGWRVLKPGGVLVASTPQGSHHYDPFHMGPVQGGWSEEAIRKMLAQWRGEVVKVASIAEQGQDPSCFLIVLRKGGANGSASAVGSQ